MYENEGYLTYTYDDVGNIETIKENGVLKATYHYDQFGQLVREDNAWAGRTYLYHYDAGGNLTQVQECQCRTDVLHQTDLIGNTNYSYATGTETDGSPVWKDLLTSYNGNTITYDAIGNPLNWGTDISDMHWNNGRRLTYLQKRTNMISYAYDETGLRTEKSTNTNRTYFDRDASGNLVHEFRDYSGYLGEDSHLYYYYDANGSIGSISYNGVRYAFRKNLQGDIIAILDTSGNVAARYTYDAWGKVLSVTDANGNANTSSTFIGNVNPIRYRGYYYDTETGWYYLNSRYYDPQVKRFINADAYVSTGQGMLGHNMFAYCLNNPVRYVDVPGFMAAEAALVATNWWNPVGWIAGVVVAVEVVALVVVTVETVDAVSDYAFEQETAVVLDNIQLKKQTSKSGKEKASDKPSWVNKDMVDTNKSAEKNAIDILNKKYGPGKWGKGAGTEFNKIKKWIQRDLGLPSFFIGPDEDNAFWADENTFVVRDTTGQGFGWINGFYYTFVC